MTTIESLYPYKKLKEKLLTVCTSSPFICPGLSRKANIIAKEIGNDFIGICKSNEILIDILYVIYEADINLLKDVIKILTAHDRHQMRNTDKVFNILYHIVGLYDNEFSKEYSDNRERIMKSLCEDKVQKISLEFFLILETSEKFREFVLLIDDATLLSLADISSHLIFYANYKVHPSRLEYLFNLPYFTNTSYSDKKKQYS